MKLFIGILSVVLCLRTFASQTAANWDRSVSEFPRQAGETDDTARIQRAVNATASGVVHVPAGLYTVSSTIMVTVRMRAC